MILVDDGLATGATMMAAVESVRAHEPDRVVVAVPVGSKDALEQLSAVADDVVCVVVPEPMAGRRALVRGLLRHQRRRGSAVDSVPTPRRSLRLMAATATTRRAQAFRDAVAITGATTDYDGLLELVGDRRLVLLGEATHGTHEFYRERARITKRLIEEKGFNAVAVEADWPDAYRVNRYVMGQSSDPDATSALADFERFPAWMWRNRDVVGFVEWLRARNDSHAHHQTKARFYGLDLYSLRASMEAVVAYLETVDPDAARDARERYSCFDHVDAEGPRYGRAVALHLKLPCEKEVVAELVDLRRRAHAILNRDGWAAEDDYFVAEQQRRVGTQRRGVLPPDVPRRGLLVEPP